jgi:hypothetical protein
LRKGTRSASKWETPAEREGTAGVPAQRRCRRTRAAKINLLEDDNFVRTKKAAADGYAPCSRARALKNSRRAFAPALLAPCLDTRRLSCLFSGNESSDGARPAVNSLSVRYRRPSRARRHRWGGQVNRQPSTLPHPILKYWCALNITSPGQSRGRAGASLLTAVRLSQRVDLLTRLIYVPLGDSRWAYDHGADSEQYCSRSSLIHRIPPKQF